MSKVTIETIRQKEEEFMKMKKELAELRKQVPLEQVEDYAFLDTFGNPVKLSSLFGNKNELILVHNMGTSCSYCTLWADGLNGFTPHLENQAAFVVESIDDPAIQRRFAMDRGWKFKMISSKRTSFRKDMGFASPENEPWPGVSTFVMKDGKVFRASSAFFGPGDNFCSLWDLMDLLPNKRDYENTGLDYFYFAPKMKYGQDNAPSAEQKKGDCCS